MTIEYEKYLLKQDNSRFNLIKKVTRNKLDENKNETGETYEVEETIGYGFKLENAIKEIISDKLENNKSVVTLKEFITAYQKEVDLIYKMVKL